jgi:hypothetical protein
MANFHIPAGQWGGGVTPYLWKITPLEINEYS